MCLAIPGKILDVATDGSGLPTGRVDFNGAIKNVCLAYVPQIRVGDFVIVHVGFAISRLDEEEARRVFSYLEQIGETGELSAP